MRVLAELVDEAVVITVEGLQKFGDEDQAALVDALADGAAWTLRGWFAEEPPDARLTAHDLFDRGRSVAQVAALLGVDRDTVREWKREGRRP